jgi:putative transposase
VPRNRLTSSATDQLVAEKFQRYRQHPNWSYQLHTDNLVVLIEKEPTLGAPPSYTSVLRFMRDHALIKRPRRGPVYSSGAQVTEHRIETREIRSYESEYINALWHLDFHHGSLRVLINKGRWIYPLLLGIIDDHSRLCCHAQWYLAEGAEELCHGLCQALQKRALPQALMSDNGSAMLAAETTEGLARLGIVHEKTLPYAPFQNRQTKKLLNGIEGRLLPLTWSWIAGSRRPRHGAKRLKGSLMRLATGSRKVTATTLSSSKATSPTGCFSRAITTRRLPFTANTGTNR